MAAPTEATITKTSESVWRLETQVITNQTANTATIVKGLHPPEWAAYATFYLHITSMGGTSPLLDFKLEALDPTNPQTAAAAPLGSWDGITQKTAGTDSLTTIDVGPALTVDDTGSATASDNYKVDAPLPSQIQYTITTDGTTDDEDYTFNLSVEWHRHP